METPSQGLTANHYPLTEVIDLGDSVVQLESVTQARLARVSTGEIAQLSALLDIVASRIKSAQGEILKTYTSRYAEQAKAQLLTQGKDTGTTHLIDSDYDISVEIGKTVTWDTKGLTDLVTKIEASGDDPREFIEVKYSVSEAKYKAWPQSLRAPFEQLRTVSPKAPKFVLRRVDNAGGGK